MMTGTVTTHLGMHKNKERKYMRNIYLSLLILFVGMSSTVFCVNHNELKFLRMLQDQRQEQHSVYRGVNNLDLHELIKQLEKERDEVRGLLLELADFAEGNT